MCRAADLETVWTITESLADGFTLRGPQAVASRFYDNEEAPRLWHVAADIEGAGAEGEGPFAVWIVTLSQDGDVSIVSTDPVAGHFSTLPARESVEGFPKFVDGFTEAVSCVAYGLQQWSAPPPAAFIPPGCAGPDEAILDLIAGSLNEPYLRLRAAMMSAPVSTGDGNQTVVVAADIEGFDMEGVGPLAVWVVAVMSDGELYAISANLAAQSNSSLPGPSGVRYVPGDAPGYAEAVACVQMALAG
jgi:hypothetical protein